MHMSDALISPIVGGVMVAGAAGAAAWSVRKMNREDLIESKKVPMMGVMGAFVFAAQMMNFTIPGTGSSGHIAGGLLLAAMLGPEAAFLTMIPILLIQALFFGDGGLLALGCNIINMGFFSCLVAYPLIFKPLVKKGMTPGRVVVASILASVVGLQLGAFSVVLEALLSGRSELPFGTFVLLMQPIHLAIGVVEGFITSAVFIFLRRAAPEALPGVEVTGKAGFPKRAFALIAVLALITGGALSWFASANPDGLEWSMIHVAGTAELESDDTAHKALGSLQEKTAILPDYGFKASAEASQSGEEEAVQWPAVSVGTSVSGIVGGALTLGLAALVGFAIVLPRRRRARQAQE